MSKEKNSTWEELEKAIESDREKTYKIFLDALKKTEDKLEKLWQHNEETLKRMNDHDKHLKDTYKAMNN